MHTIEAVAGEPSRNSARELFREYGDFLRSTGSCGYFDCGHFDHAKFADETHTLPDPYTTHNGEVLLARVEGAPAACIAYRATTLQPGSSEIKRLYVRPAFRGRGLARALVAEALTRMIARGFTHAALDTDVENMLGALNLYQTFGFRISQPQNGPIAFLERKLP